MNQNDQPDPGFSDDGVPWEQLAAELDALKAADADWAAGRVPLYVFKGSEDAFRAGRDAFFKFFNENALGAGRAFPSLKTLESDVVAMGLALLQAPAGATGHMTSGGSESIIVAVHAAREQARARGARSGANLVLAESAHPAFSKAAALMSLTERRVPVGPDFRADVGAMSAAVDDDTVMIVGSAPCFPYGVIDPIDALGDLAQRRGLWLHVDACIGGYLAPFVRDIGYPIPPFDFAVPGVRSLSADLHKFGFCPKPASTVFYRSADLAAFGVFELDVWPSGPYRTSTLVGTRPGGAVAGAWATMRTLGRNGYRRIAGELMTMRDAYLHDLDARAGYRPLGRPDLTVMAFRRDDVDPFRVGEGLAARGWVPGLVRRPPALHLMMSMLHAPSRERYVDDLIAATREARETPGVAATLRASY